MMKNWANDDEKELTAIKQTLVSEIKQARSQFKSRIHELIERKLTYNELELLRNLAFEMYYHGLVSENFKDEIKDYDDILLHYLPMHIDTLLDHIVVRSKSYHKDLAKSIVSKLRPSMTKIISV